MKKVFSVHLSLASFEVLKTRAVAEKELAKEATKTFRDFLSNNRSEDSDFPVEVDESVLLGGEQRTSARIACSASARESQWIHAMADKARVSANEFYSAIVDYQIKGTEFKSPLFVKDSLSIRVQKIIKFPLNEQQSQCLEFLSQFDEDSASSEVHALEVPTGAGKTLLVSGLAACLAQSNKRSWIAVPTLAVQKQFLNEIRSAIKSPTPVALVSGRPEFVSRDRLLNLLSENEDLLNKDSWVDKAHRWINLYADKVYGFDRRTWLVDSLLEHCPDLPFPASEYALTTDCDKEDDGNLAYEYQFEAADRASLVLLTHCYLALESYARIWAARRAFKKNEIKQEILDPLAVGKFFSEEYLECLDQKSKILSSYVSEEEIGRLVLPQFLFVDEAHLLPQGFSNVSTRRVSLRRFGDLLSDLKTKKLLGFKDGYSPKTISQLQDLIASLGKFGKHEDAVRETNYFIGGGDAKKEEAQALSYIEGISMLLDGIQIKSSAKSAEVSQAIYAIKQAAFAAKGVSNSVVAMLSNSPIRGYPQVAVSPRYSNIDIRNLLKGMGLYSTFLLSATIFVPSAAGAWSSRDFLTQIGLRENESKGFKTSVPRWAVDPVSVYMPPENALRPLVIPNSTDTDLQWLESSALIAQWVTQKAHGGTLCLMTSYMTARYLYEELKKLGVPASQMLLAKTGESLTTQKERFLSARKEGKKVLWIGVGGCWTGLNVPDVPSEGLNDVITDLIIPRFPFGVNRSLIEQERQGDPRYFFQALDSVARYLKQGVGRLVRQSGLPNNRNIYLLDGRMYLSSQKALRNVVNTLMRDYKSPLAWPKAIVEQLGEVGTLPEPLAVPSPPLKKKNTEESSWDSAVKKMMEPKEIRSGGVSLSDIDDI